MKITENMLFVFYIGVVVMTAAYLVFSEGVLSGSHYIHLGGRDSQFTFYDVTLILVFLLSSGLAVISTKAYMKKKNERLLFVASAFFLFALKAALKLIENFAIGYFGYIGISIQALEVLVLISLFFALLTK